MRIISDMHDYYDTAMAQGADQSLVYLRKTETRPGADARIGIDLTALPRLEEIYRARTRRTSYADAFAQHVLLFCGQVVPFVERIQRPNGFGPNMVVSQFWDLASLDAAIAETEPEIRDEYRHRFEWKHRFSRLAVQMIFDHRYDATRIAEAHTAYASPIILFRNVYRNKDCADVETVINPNLKEIGFQTQRGPFETFQEIAMYLGGVMRTPERDTVAITDADRAAKHGFDRWSFRKKVR
jgi:hypothetical protein